MANPKIYLDIQGRQIPFPGAKVSRRLNKNIIPFKLPYFESSGTGGTTYRDLLRTEGTFTVSGTWEDDPKGKYDGWPSFGRYQLIMAIAKKKRVTCTFVWHSQTFSTVIKSVKITKYAGYGNDMNYDLTLVRVTEKPA